MGSRKPQPKVLSIWRITLSLAMCVPAFLVALFFRFASPMWLVLTAAWMVLYLLGFLLYLPLRYHWLSYSVTEERILLYSGVLYVRERNIPLRGIQFTTVSANPVERVFGLCSVVVISAGGRCVIPGLDRAEGDALAAALVDHR